VNRQIIILVLVAVTLSTAVNAVVSSVSRPEAAGAATAASDADIVRQLKRANANLRAVNSRLGQTQVSKGSVRGLLTIICDYTASISCSP
jgi:hypothetical protein